MRPPTLVALVLVTLLDVFATPSRPAAGVPAHRSGTQDNAQVRASDATPAQQDLAWSEAVQRHQPGQIDAPAKVVAGWSADDLQKVGGRVRAGLDAALKKAILQKTGEEIQRVRRLIGRGVLLHTDVALSLEGTGAAGFSNVIRLADGRTQGPGNSLHFEFAAALLELDSDRPARETAHGWYRAVTALLLHRGRLGDVAMLLRLWRASVLGEGAANPRAFPDDDRFLFDYGCLHEGLAAPGARVVLGDAFAVVAGGTEGASAGLERSISPGARPWRFQVSVADFSVHLEEAFQAYRRVVELNRGAAEARVRLGHVECARGNCGSGMRHMRAGADLATDDPAVRYYAAMFLGQAEEARGRYEEARQEYERAAALFPLAQSPLLALGALADRIGDREAAGRHASRLWALPADGEHRYDPWWDYDGGPRDGEELLRQVYRLMAGGVDDRQ